jgi:hypothetical protein
MKIQEENGVEMASDSCWVGHRPVHIAVKQLNLLLWKLNLSWFLFSFMIHPFFLSTLPLPLPQNEYQSFWKKKSVYCLIFTDFESLFFSYSFVGTYGVARQSEHWTKARVSKCQCPGGLSWQVVWGLDLGTSPSLAWLNPSSGLTTSPTSTTTTTLPQ